MKSVIGDYNQDETQSRAARGQSTGRRKAGEVAWERPLRVDSGREGRPRPGSNLDLRINRSASPSERAVWRRRARFYATARQRRPGRVWEIGWGHGAICGRY